nr:hypothetical protein [Tanacetum cinerariifolium]
MGNEHFDTILETESDEFIKSSVENLVPSPCDSENLSDSECDMPACGDFTTFSNFLFDADYDFSSSDDELFFDEDISKKIYSNPIFDEEIISMKIEPHHFNVESDLIESLLNHDSSIVSSPSKIDSLLDDPGESEDDSECDVPACDDFTTFSNLLFDADDDFSSSNNESISDEDILKEIYSNPLFNEEIISMKIDPHHFNGMKDSLNENLSKIKGLLVETNEKIKIALGENDDEMNVENARDMNKTEVEKDEEMNKDTQKDDEFENKEKENEITKAVNTKRKKDNDSGKNENVKKGSDCCVEIGKKGCEIRNEDKVDNTSVVVIFEKSLLETLKQPSIFDTTQEE